MYLYFGKDGKLKTKINHDAPPRQGGDLNVTVCLDMDFWDNKERWGVDGDKYWVKTARIKLASGVLGFPITATEGQVEVFSKLYNSEIVYDLVPGASYLMYKFRFSAEEVTKIPGQIEFNFSMQNLSFSDNKYVRVGTRSEFIKMGKNPGNGENCISRELDNVTGKISSVVYKKGNGIQDFIELSSVSEDKYQVGTYQDRMGKSLTNNDEGFVFVQQDKNPDEYTYGEVSIWMWAKATGAATTCEWIQLPQYSTTDIIPTDGTFAFGVTDITIERTVGYARALIDKEIGIKYQDIMDEFKRVYSKIAIAGTKPDWNVGENTSPAYIYNKPNIKTVLVDDIGSIRETGVYIVKNSTIAPLPVSGDYVLVHEKQNDSLHMQIVRENQNVLWFRHFDGEEWSEWGKRDAEKERNDLEAKLNENIALNPNKTYILFQGKSISTHHIVGDERSLFDVDYGDGTSDHDVDDINHTYSDGYNVHIITVTESLEDGTFYIDGITTDTEESKIKVLYFSEGLKSFDKTFCNPGSKIDVLVLPSTTENIKSGSFRDVKTVYCKFADVPNIDNWCFLSAEKIFVKKSIYEDIINDDQWGFYKSKIYYDIDSEDLIYSETKLYDSLKSHTSDVDNPHKVTKEQVGLSDVENYSPAEMPISNATKLAIDKLTDDKVDRDKTITTYNKVYYKGSDGITSTKISTSNKIPGSVAERDDNGNISVSDPKENEHAVNKGHLEERISTRIPETDKGVANGVATIGADGKIPMSQIPDSIAVGLIYGGTFYLDKERSKTISLSDAAIERTKKSDTCLAVEIAEGANDKELGYKDAQGLFFKVTSETEINFAGFDFYSGDQLLSTTNSWDKIDNSDKVNSVNGMVGDVEIPAVQYTEQNLSDDQKSTARDNLDVYSKRQTDDEIQSVWDYISEDAPIIEKDLTAQGFQPVANMYYKHIGETVDTLINGVIYFYNGKTYNTIDGKEEIYIGDEEPEEKAKLWIDTSEQSPLPSVVRANPALSANAPVLTGISVDGQGYKVPSYTVESFLSETSENAVMNRVVTVNLSGKIDKSENEAYEIYAHNGAAQTRIPVGSEPLGNIVMLTDSDGYLKVKDPVSDDNPVNKKTLDSVDNKKMDKAGGTFTGDVIFQKDIYVAGTATYENQQSLGIKDPVIVTNIDGVTLNSILSGLAIRKDSSDTYGIMYDPSDDTVKFGKGIFDNKTKRFTFNEGEGNALTIRADSSKITNTHLMVWDSSKNMLVDGGNSVNELLNVIVSDTEPEESEEMPEIWVDTAEEADLGNLVYANPALGGDEANLKSIQIGYKKYKIPSGESSENDITITATSGSFTSEQINILQSTDAKIIYSGMVFRKTEQSAEGLSYRLSTNSPTTDESSVFFQNMVIPVSLSTKTYSISMGSTTLKRVDANQSYTATKVLENLMVGNTVYSMPSYYNHKIAFQAADTTTFTGYIYINCISSVSAAATSVYDIRAILDKSYGSISGFTTTASSIFILYNYTSVGMLVFMSGFGVGDIKQLGIAPGTLDESSISDTVLAL